MLGISLPAFGRLGRGVEFRSAFSGLLSSAPLLDDCFLVTLGSPWGLTVMPRMFVPQLWCPNSSPGVLPGVSASAPPGGGRLLFARRVVAASWY